MSRVEIERPRAERLLEELVRIPSPSGEEAPAARFLVEAMESLGFERAGLDGAGNAVGEIGDPRAPHLLVLLGHVDTVPGAIPVRRERVEGQEVLYGRGSVDAKGSLASFVAAAGRLGACWARRHELRLLVAGAVEEEAATSRGARHLVARIDGEAQLRPAACVIGEPSGWDRITLGYKGRLLIELRGEREMTHTAGPDRGLAAVAARLWGWLESRAERHNAGVDRAFDQLQPSLRHLSTDRSDPFYERIDALYGLRLPLGFDSGRLEEELLGWAAAQLGATAEGELAPPIGGGSGSTLRAGTTGMELAFRGREAAWRESPNGPLVRGFLRAIRGAGGSPRFVVKTGTSDLNVVAPRWRCPILAYGPGDSRLDHTPNEHLPLDEYWRSVQVLEAALRAWGESR